jgi:hypothetical protein
MMPPSFSVDEMLREYVRQTLVVIGAVTPSTSGVA